MEPKSQKNKALIISISFHAAIIGVCFFFTLYPPYPLPPEVSMEVAMADLGTTLEGSGDLAPTNVDLPSSATEQIKDFTAQTSTANDAPTQDLVTDDAGETALPTATKTNEKTRQTDAPSKESTASAPKPSVNKSALFSGAMTKNEGEGGTGEGDGGEGADKGLPDGVKGGKGLGIGNGSYILAGRSLVKEASLGSTREEGVVVMKIWVDRRGNIFKAQPILDQCTTTSETLFAKARKACTEYKFDVKEDAPPEQVGKFVFKFTLR